MIIWNWGHPKFGSQIKMPTWSTCSRPPGLSVGLPGSVVSSLPLGDVAASLADHLPLDLGSGAHFTLQSITCVTGDPQLVKGKSGE
jgi:hypothetical protein